MLASTKCDGFAEWQRKERSKFLVEFLLCRHFWGECCRADLKEPAGEFKSLCDCPRSLSCAPIRVDRHTCRHTYRQAATQRRYHWHFSQNEHHFMCAVFHSCTLVMFAIASSDLDSLRGVYNGLMVFVSPEEDVRFLATMGRPLVGDCSSPIKKNNTAPQRTEPHRAAPLLWPESMHASI